MDSLGGSITASGSITVSGSIQSNANIIASGIITANTRLNTPQINSANGQIDSFATHPTGNQYIYGSSIIVGNPTGGSTTTLFGDTISIGSVGINTVSLNGMVYINGVLLLPWSSATSFFSQW